MRDEFTMSSSTLGLLTDRQTYSVIHTDRETNRHAETYRDADLFTGEVFGKVRLLRHLLQLF